MEHGAAGGSDGRKLPFYMTFPFSENLSAESENERDMQSDRWEYDGSAMYAQYPDRIWIHREAERIGRQLAEEAQKDENDGTNTRAQALTEMAELLLLQEIYRRRCRRRRVRGHFVY